MTSQFVISSPTNNQERKNIQSFFNDLIPFLRKDAIPKEELDYVAKPLLLQAIDTNEKIVAALLAGIPYLIFQVRVGPANLNLKRKFSEQLKHVSEIRELELIAVDRSVRNEGLASELIQRFERKYKSQGVKFVFGSVVDEQNADRLKTFYSNRGYKITNLLPEFFGVNWTPIGEPAPLFYFYKKISK